MIGFGLTDYRSFGAYLHLNEILLDEIVEKYELKATNVGVGYSFPDRDASMYLN